MIHPPRWVPVPVTVETDLQLGGRWTSLRSGDREWLWTNPDPAAQLLRQRVGPGDAFVDAGGVEEALPTVRGTPDHGDVWNRPWRVGLGEGVSEVDCGLTANGSPVRGRLRRSLTSMEDSVQAHYQVTGPAGATFLHAVHALLELPPKARVEPMGQFDVFALDEPVPGQDRAVVWPSGLDRLGPDDGTAICVLFRGCRGVQVVDGQDRLTMTWSADVDEWCSLLLWRNLGGWPQPSPYRSIGVEPMVGRSVDHSSAQPGDCVTLPADGLFRWSLRVAAHRLVSVDWD